MTTDDADRRAAMNTAQSSDTDGDHDPHELSPANSDPSKPERTGVGLGPGTAAQCQAMRSDGVTRCRNPARIGMRVCRIHGGSSPNAIEGARRRLLSAIEPAMEALVEIAMDPRAKDADRLRAIDSLADRSGLPRATQVEVGQTRQGLLDRLDALPSGGAQSSGEGDADQLSAVGPDAPELEDSDTVAVSSPSQPVDESPGEPLGDEAGNTSSSGSTGLHVEPSHGVQSEAHHTESTKGDHE